jgi:hypothetical protein
MACLFYPWEFRVPEFKALSTQEMRGQTTAFYQYFEAYSPAAG